MSIFELLVQQFFVLNLHLSRTAAFSFMFAPTYSLTNVAEMISADAYGFLTRALPIFPPCSVGVLVGLVIVFVPLFSRPVSAFGILLSIQHIILCHAHNEPVSYISALVVSPFE